MRQGEGCIQPFCQEVALGVPGGKIQRFAVAFRHADHMGLRGTGLDLLVHLGERGGNETLVRPAALRHAGFQLTEERTVAVVKAGTVRNDEVGTGLVADFHVAHHVIVFRIGSPDDRPDNQPATGEQILCAIVRTRSMERAATHGKVGIVPLAAVRNDVHGATQRVTAERGGNHTFVYFYALDHIDRQIRQRNAGTLGIERNAIQKVADGVARKAVDGEVVIRADSPLFADADAGGAVDCRGDAVERARDRLDVQRIDGVGALA